MRILIVSKLPLDTGNIKGGVEAATINLLDGFLLLDDDIEVRVLSLHKYPNATAYYKNSILISYASVSPVYMCNYNKIKNIIDNYKPDVIHIQGGGPHLLNYMLFNKNNIVITQHGVLAHEYNTKEDIYNKIKYYIKYKIDKWAYPKYKYYIFISKYNNIPTIPVENNIRL